MSYNKAGTFRGCHIFDTHEASFHLDENNEIVWVECDKIKNWIFWLKTWLSIKWWIWNPVVFAIENMRDDEKTEILAELNITYMGRISRILSQQTQIETQQAA